MDGWMDGWREGGREEGGEREGGRKGDRKRRGRIREEGSECVREGDLVLNALVADNILRPRP
jgi:hypothetical protein